MRLIDADALIAEYDKAMQMTVSQMDDRVQRGAEDVARKLIDETPTIEAYTEQDVRNSFNAGYSIGMEQGMENAVRHGYWIFKGKSGGRSIYQCSVCKNDISGSAAYCKECGAKMDLPKETEKGEHPC